MSSLRVHQKRRPKWNVFQIRVDANVGEVMNSQLVFARIGLFQDGQSLMFVTRIVGCELLTWFQQDSAAHWICFVSCTHSHAFIQSIPKFGQLRLMQAASPLQDLAHAPLPPAHLSVMHVDRKESASA